MHTDSVIETIFEKITTNGWIILIYKNTVGWTIQLKNASTGQIKRELQHGSLIELLEELSQTLDEFSNYRAR